MERGMAFIKSPTRNVQVCSIAQMKACWRRNAQPFEGIITLADNFSDRGCDETMQATKTNILS